MPRCSKNYPNKELNMQSYMQTVVIGRLTKDPESKTLSDIQKSSFTLAVDRNYTKEDGSRDTDFFQVVAWGKLGEICQNYLKKGRLVLIEGRFQNRSYESNGRTNWITELVAEKMQMMDYPKKNKTEESSPAEAVLAVA